MSIKKISIAVVVIILATLLTSCTSGSAAVNSYSGVAVSSDMVFFANGGKVSALRSSNGNLAWEYPEKISAKRLFYAQPVIVGEQVLVADYEYKLTSLNTLDGSENWIFSGAKGRYIDSPIVINDTIIAPNADYSIYALDLNGKLKWTFTGGHAFWAQPVSDGNAVYVSCMDHFLYAIDLEKGSLLWKTELGAALVSRPLLDETGRLFIGNIDGTYYAVSEKDGSKLWEQKMGSGVWAQAILLEGKLYFGDQAGRVNILNSEDGKSIQYIETDGAILGKGAVLEQGIVFGNENGDLVMINFDGDKIWTRTVDGKIYGSLVFDGSQILVPVSGSTEPLVAMDSNGNENWSYSEKK